MLTIANKALSVTAVVNLGITKTSAENRIAVFLLKVVVRQAESAVARVERDKCSVVARQAESAVARVERERQSDFQ